MGKPYAIDILGQCNGSYSNLPQVLIPANKLWSSNNVEPDLRSGSYPAVIRTRPGMAKVHTTAASGTIYSIFIGSLGSYYTDQGTVTYVRNLAGTALHTIDPCAVIVTPCWRTHNALDIMVDGTNYLKTADGTTFATLSGIPAGAKWLASYNRFLVCAGHDSNGIRWTDIGTAETWTASNELILKATENDAVTGIHEFEDLLAVLCRKSVIFIQGYSGTDFTVVKTIRHFGSELNETVCRTPYGLFLMSKYGLTWIKPDLSWDFPVQRQLSKRVTGQSPYFPMTRGTMVYDPGTEKVMVWYDTAGRAYTDTRLDYYPRFDAVFLHTSGTATNVCAAASSYNTTAKYWYVYGGGAAAPGTNFLMYANSGVTDLGTDIAVSARTREFGVGGGPGITKAVRDAVFIVNSGDSPWTVTVRAYINNNGYYGGDYFDSSFTFTDTGTQKITVPINRTCYQTSYDLIMSAGKSIGVAQGWEYGEVVDSR